MDRIDKFLSNNQLEKTEQPVKVKKVVKKKTEQNVQPEVQQSTPTTKKKVL